MKESSKETLKTYGEKPTPFLFTFDDTGVAESYYLGSEVRKYKLNSKKKFLNFFFFFLDWKLFTFISRYFV